MKQHISYQEAAEFWMPGPKTEEAYTWLIHHVHQCSACRDRLWGALMQLRSAAEGLDKLMNKFIETSTGGLSSDSQLGAQFGLNPSEFDAVGALLAKAFEVVKQKPNQTVWSAAELFNDGRYDQVEHFARCKTCHSRMNQLYQVARAVRSGMERGGASADDQMAMTKVCEWFEQLFARVQKLNKAGGVNPLSTSSGTYSFCN